MHKPKIGILGSGMVGKTLAEGFVKQGHLVKIASRKPMLLQDFVTKIGKGITAGDFRETADYGEIIIICVKGIEYEEAITLAGKENFLKKIVMDVTNPLLFEEAGRAPVLEASYPDSNGVLIQNLLPKSYVVKIFNSVPAPYMINPVLNQGVPTLFMCGNDPSAKKTVRELAHAFGWKDIVDIGEIKEAYILEALAMLWIKYGFDTNTWVHAFTLLRK